MKIQATLKYDKDNWCFT